ncbi:MAG: hypothetical protein Q8O19_01050, partial [Rectinemataceae bacterium]|nr:hypothetical protein [Rectinemataceae bacterium]
AISKEMFDKRVEALILKKFNGPLPAPMPNDPSIILRELNLTLQDGYVWISGKATKQIDCWPDANIEFSGKAYLGLTSTGKLVVSAKDIKVDLPWWADFLGAIFTILNPMFGGFFLYTINELVGGIASSTLSSQAVDLIGNLTMFAQEVPATAASAVSQVPRVEVRNRHIRVKSDALILAGDIILMLKGDVQGLFVGNLNSSEVHRQECEWVLKIAQKHRVEFSGIAEALWQGYNGCWYCLRFYDTDQFKDKSK